jgi:ATP-dependent Clp protease ATP-binding subunit ClpC
MLFLGPSGVGKTELARAVAETFFHDASALIRLDMSEYAEGFTSSKLIGAPAGYVGYREGSTLTDRVKQKPYGVVLFDELEKAHRDVQNLLLQILEEGELTDATGRKVNFRNAVVIMTSNVGLERFESGGIGFVSGEEERRGALAADVRKELETRFRPELLNRVDLTSLFRPLAREALAAIAEKQIGELVARLAERGVKLSPQGAVAKAVAEATDPKFGARDIRRHIQTRIEDKIADLLTKGPKRIRVRITNGDIEVK